MNWLKDLEARVQAEGREWMRRRLAEELQVQAKRLGALCPSTGCLLKYRQTTPFTLYTCAGLVQLRVPSGYSKALKRRVHPLREYCQLAPHHRLSPELQDRLVFNATQTGSYESAAQVATRWGTPISDDTVHAVVQQVGQRAESMALLPPPPLQNPEFSLVIMMDGWMVRRRGGNWGADPAKKVAERVEWKEVKSAVIYQLETRTENASGRGLLVKKYIVVNPPETSPLDFGAAVKAEALRRGLATAEHVYVVIDGAVWLWNLAQDRFAQADLLLDFHHASEHLWAIANTLHGQGTPEARTWAEDLLHKLRHGSEAKVLTSLEELLSPEASRTVEEKNKLRTPVEYFRTHRNHLHYESNADKGAPIGSGSVESLCSQLQNRFKCTGQFWSPDGLRHLLKLEELVRNDDAIALWA